jgi:hypothetical protein
MFGVREMKEDGYGNGENNEFRGSSYISYCGACNRCAHD